MTEDKTIPEANATPAEPVKVESPSLETGLETAARVEREIQLGDPTTTKMPTGETVEEARTRLRAQDEVERKQREDATWKRVREQYGMNETTATRTEGVAVIADPGSSSLRLVEETPPAGESESVEPKVEPKGEQPPTPLPLGSTFTNLDS